MIYSRTEEIILLHSSDGRATFHEVEGMKGTPTTTDNLILWKKWFFIINEADENPSLKAAIEQAEFIYDLCRDNR